MLCKMFSSHAQDLCTSLLRLWGGNEFWKICKQTKSSEQQGKLRGYTYKCSQTSVPEDWRWRSSSNEIRIWKCHIFKKRRMAGWWEGGTGSFSSSPSICSLFGHSSLEGHLHPMQCTFTGVNTPSAQGESKWPKSCQAYISISMHRYITQ